MILSTFSIKGFNEFMTSYQFVRNGNLFVARCLFSLLVAFPMIFIFSCQIILLFLTIQLIYAKCYFWSNSARS